LLELALNDVYPFKLAGWHSPKPVDNYLTQNWADELVLLIDFQSLFFAINRAINDKN
jgi:hypothetical protein